MSAGAEEPRPPEEIKDAIVERVRGLLDPERVEPRGTVWGFTVEADGEDEHRHLRALIEELDTYQVRYDMWRARVPTLESLLADEQHEE